MPRLAFAVVAASLMGLAWVGCPEHGPDPRLIFAPDGRLVHTAGRPRLPCPEQTGRMAVILAMGQSNIANHAEQPFETQFPERSAAWFEGSCRPLQSPLLGASGQGGEFLTPMVDRLLDQGVFDRVVVAPAAIGGTSLARWLAPPLRDLWTMTARHLAHRYSVTHVLWHQGESDTRTATQDYITSFRQMRQALDEAGVTAPIHVAVSTYCRPLDADWTPDNPAARALRHLPALVPRTKAGPDLDRILQASDRIEDCHLGRSGQLVVAHAWASVLAQR